MIDRKYEGHIAYEGQGPVDPYVEPGTGPHPDEVALDATTTLLGSGAEDGVYGLATGGLITSAVRDAALSGDALTVTDTSLGVWPDTTNDLVNSNFSQGTTGWTIATGTQSVVTTPLKFGAKSLQVVASGGIMSIYQDVTTTATGTWSGSVWVYVAAGSPAIGRRGQLQLQERGGAQAQSTFANYFDPINGVLGKTLVAGWQKLTATGTIVQPDRTSVRLQVNMTNSPIAGDTMVIAAPQLERKAVATPYVPSAATSGVRAAGRVRMPQWRISPRRGWLAVRVRPSWASAAPPVSPVVLYRWGSATSYIELAYLSGAIRFRRVTTAGIEEVTRDTRFATGTVLTILARWTSLRCSLSVNGQPFSNGQAVTFDDSFERADTADTLGIAPTGQTWLRHGSGIPRILSGRYQHANETLYPDARLKLYMRVDLADTPVRRTASVSFLGTSGPQTSVVLISSDDPYTAPGTGNAFHHMLHPSISVGAWSVNTYDNLVASPLIASGNWPLVSGATIFDAGFGYNRLLTDGTVYDVTLDVDVGTSSMRLQVLKGASVLLDRVITHPDIATHHGRYTIWQTFNPTGDVVPRYEGVSAESANDTDSTAPRIPAFMVPLADIGSADGSSAHLHGDVLWAGAGSAYLTNNQASALHVLGQTPIPLSIAYVVPDLLHVWSGGV